MKKIYIIGPIGGGKTTFSRKLSEKYNIKCYELDKVSWDDENGHIKRTSDEILEIFDTIINNKSWIIEDVGRDIFKKGRDKADIIYYIKITKFKSYYRVAKRLIRQKLGIEEYNCPPSFKEWKYLVSAIKKYYDKEHELLESLKLYQDKLVFVNSKMINKILNG